MNNLESNLPQSTSAASTATMNAAQALLDSLPIDDVDSSSSSPKTTSSTKKIKVKKRKSSIDSTNGSKSSDENSANNDNSTETAADEEAFKSGSGSGGGGILKKSGSTTDAATLNRSINIRLKIRGGHKVHIGYSDTIGILATHSITESNNCY